MIIKFEKCNSYFCPQEIFRFNHKIEDGFILLKSLGESRIDGYPLFLVLYSDDNKLPLDSYDYRFKYENISIVKALEDQIAGFSGDGVRILSKKDTLYELMCRYFDVSENVIHNDQEFVKIIRRLNLDSILDIGKF